MITVNQFVFNPFQENTFVLFDETKEAVIVDPGCYSVNEQNALTNFVRENGLKVIYTLNTHCHVDHILGIDFAKETFGAKSIAHAEDQLLLQTAVQHAMAFGLALESAPSIDTTVEHGDTITFGNSALQVIHTPGHSLGGICFYHAQQKMLFAGDTLFRGSIGRTDLPGGDFDTIIESIAQRLLVLPDDVTVYSGHGDSSTIGFEKVKNPFLSNV